MLPESIPPFGQHEQEREGGDYDKRQSELIQDILDFYLERRKTASLNSDIAITPPSRARARPRTNSPKVNNSPRSSSWEGTWDTSTITVQRTSIINNLVYQIDVLLAEEQPPPVQVLPLELRSDSNPNPDFDLEPSLESSPRRRLTILEPPPVSDPNPDPNPTFNYYSEPNPKTFPQRISPKIEPHPNPNLAYTLEPSPESTPLRRITVVHPSPGTTAKDQQ
ncbi:hypothetical protein BDV06DRAFT_189595 [Aspergillus oleicola]